MNSDAISAPFSGGIRTGLVLMLESACISAIAVCSLLCHIVYVKLKRYRETLASRKRSLVPITDASDSIFFIGLMVGDLLQSIGGMLNSKWIRDGFIQEGSVCTTQAVLKHVADVAVALMSLLIAIQTFAVLILRIHSPPWVPKVVAFLVWVGVITMVAVSSTAKRDPDIPFYGNTGFWCWIRMEYELERMVFQYLWIWFAAGVMFILYGITALVMRGIIIVDDGIYFATRNRVPVDITLHNDSDNKDCKTVANLMLFYPVVYLACVFPLGFVRGLEFGGMNVHPAALMFASAVFSLSGLFNVVLFKSTRSDFVVGPEPIILVHSANPRDLGILPDRHNVSTFGSVSTAGATVVEVIGMSNLGHTGRGAGKNIPVHRGSLVGDDDESPGFLPSLRGHTRNTGGSDSHSKTLDDGDHDRDSSGVQTQHSETLVHYIGVDGVNVGAGPIPSSFSVDPGTSEMHWRIGPASTSIHKE